MNKHRTNPFAALGASSALVIFAVLSLTVFAMLSLTTVLAQQRLTEASLEAVEEYYAADLEAEILFARLRSGEEVPGVTKNRNWYTYQCALSPEQTLYVTLEQSGETWTVHRWQCSAQPEGMQETLSVYQGG